MFGFGFIIDDPDDNEIMDVLESINGNYGNVISYIKKKGKIFFYIIETSSTSSAFDVAKKDQLQFYMKLTPFHIQIAEKMSELLDDEPEWHIF